MALAKVLASGAHTPQGPLSDLAARCSPIPIPPCWRLTAWGAPALRVGPAGSPLSQSHLLHPRPASLLSCGSLRPCQPFVSSGRTDTWIALDGKFLLGLKELPAFLP